MNFKCNSSTFVFSFGVAFSSLFLSFGEKGDTSECALDGQQLKPSIRVARRLAARKGKESETEEAANWMEESQTTRARVLLSGSNYTRQHNPRWRRRRDRRGGNHVKSRVFGKSPFRTDDAGDATNNNKRCRMEMRDDVVWVRCTRSLLFEQKRKPFFLFF